MYPGKYVVCFRSPNSGHYSVIEPPLTIKGRITSCPLVTAVVAGAANTTVSFHGAGLSDSDTLKIVPHGQPCSNDRLTPAFPTIYHPAPSTAQFSTGMVFDIPIQESLPAGLQGRITGYDLLCDGNPAVKDRLAPGSLCKFVFSGSGFLPEVYPAASGLSDR
eukprot:gene5950-5840_t